MILILALLMMIFVALLIYADHKRRMNFAKDIKSRGPIYSISFDSNGNPSIEWHKTEQEILEQWQNDQR